MADPVHLRCGAAVACHAPYGLSVAHSRVSSPSPILGPVTMHQAVEKLYLCSLSVGRKARGVAVAAQPSPVEADRSLDAPPAVGIKLIAVGSRGAAALHKLVSKNAVPGAEMWCLDVDPNMLDSVPFATGVVVPKDSPPGANPLSHEAIDAIVGRTASDAAGRGNIGSADGCVAFVLAPAAAVPGGPALLCQLVRSLRGAGHFTVAAVTSPFAFEGGAKRDQAKALVDQLEELAHLVAVTEQEVLLQAFGDSQLTVAEATDIADTALEHTARCVLQAVQAQEILKSSRGALMWHGRDLRHYKRLLSPPLQQLLTCPGTAVLGRGLASLPAEAAHSMGASKALMHLASDAVLAASESPFLDGVLDTASAVLCCVNLPPVGQAFSDGRGGMAALPAIQTQEGERQATRMAAQASAGALRSITGRSCDDFVLCVEPRPLEEAVGDGSALSVEATLLVLRSPTGAKPAAESSHAAVRTPLPTVGQQAAGQTRESKPQPPPKTAGGSGRLPSTSWSMLSAMAGGAKRGAAQPQLPAPSSPQTAPTPAAASHAPAPATVPTPPAKQEQALPPAPPGSPLQGAVPKPPPPVPVARASAPPQPQLAQPAAKPQPERAPERVTVGDYLADSLTAQSLDLPPAVR